MTAEARVAATPTPERQKIQALEGLRGLMAWWVVLGHVSLTFDLGLPLIDQNTLAVDVFIILSGFVIFRLIDLKQESYPQYLIRRAFRIFPLYLIALLVSAALLWIQARALVDIPFQSPRNLGRLALTRAAIEHLPQHLLVHLPLLQGVVPDRFLPMGAYTILGQSWSVSMEWQFYVLAPLAFAALANRRWWIVLAAAVAALVTVRVHVNDAFIGAKVLLFVIGGGSYFLINRCPQTRRPIAVLALALVAALALRINGIVTLVPFGIWTAVMMSTLAPTGSWRRGLAAVLGSRALVWMGERSYSLYLVHTLPIYVGIYLLNNLGLAGPGYVIALFGITIIATMLISMGSFRCIEKPGIALGARVAGGLGATSTTKIS